MNQDILSLSAHRAALADSPEASPGALAPPDRKRVLSECEAVFTLHLKGFKRLGEELAEVIDKHKHRDGFLKAGQALSRIRDGKLWRDERPGRGEAFYRSFSDYLDRRWAISRRHAYRLLDAAEVVGGLQKLCPTGHNILPMNERQVRELKGLPAGVRQAAWDRATEGGRQPTADEVQRASDEALAQASLGELTVSLSLKDQLEARRRSIDNAENAAKATIALEPELKRRALIEKLGTRMLRLMAGDEDATSLQKGAMALAAGRGGKRLHAAAEMVRGALKGKRKRAG